MSNFCLNRLGRTLAFLFAAGGQAVAQETLQTTRVDVPGVVSAKPAKGRFVRVGDRYMVPYAQKLPGSETAIPMQPIPGGRLKMDTKPENGAPSKELVFRIAPFWMAEHEVSWKQYVEFANLYTAIKDVKRTSGEAKNSIDAVSTPTQIYEPAIHVPYSRSPDQPATGMTQFGGRQFTKWLSLRSGVQYRLPGEDEWTYACVGGKSQRLKKTLSYSQLKTIACVDNIPNGAALVGSFKANEFGLRDMLGNAAEWVIADGKHDVAAKCGLLPKQEADVAPMYGQLVCGGSWLDQADQCQPLSRLVCDVEWFEDDADFPMSPFWFAHADYCSTVGFRICRPFAALPRDEIQVYWQPDSEDLRFEDDLRVEGGRGARAPITDQIQRRANENRRSFLGTWFSKQ